MKGVKDNSFVSGTARPEIICFMAASMGLKKLKRIVPEMSAHDMSPNNKSKKRKKRCEQNRTEKRKEITLTIP